MIPLNPLEPPFLRTVRTSCIIPYNNFVESYVVHTHLTHVAPLLCVLHCLFIDCLLLSSLGILFPLPWIGCPVYMYGLDKKSVAFWYFKLWKQKYFLCHWRQCAQPRSIAPLNGSWEMGNTYCSCRLLFFVVLKLYDFYAFPLHDSHHARVMTDPERERAEHWKWRWKDTSHTMMRRLRV